MTLDDKLNDAFEEMMDYRRSVGYATATYRSSVPPFINFCIENHSEAVRITREMVNEWLNHYPYSTNSKAAFISLLREYTKYLNFLGHDDFIPDEDYAVKRIAFNPYLFTDTELSGLFNAIDLYTGKTCGKDTCPRSCSLFTVECFIVADSAPRSRPRYEPRMLTWKREMFTSASPKGTRIGTSSCQRTCAPFARDTIR